MDYQVVWDDEALAELAQVVRYVAQDNADAARKLGGEILAKAATLQTFPRLGRIFRKLKRDDVRETIVWPYRLIYHVNDAGHVVRILSVWHGARQEPDLKLP